MALREARYFSLSLMASVVVVLLLALSMASAQDYGGVAQNGGPIQFPPSPMSVETNSVVIGGSGFGFVPPRAGRYNFGSNGGYGGGSPFGGGYRGGGGGGYRGSASTSYGGYGLRGGAYQAPSQSFSHFGGYGVYYG